MLPHLGGEHVVGTLRRGLPNELGALFKTWLGNSPVRICTMAAVKLRSVLMNWPFARQQRIELALAVEA